MKKYQAKFIGRQLGAIGKFYRINICIIANNEEHAIKKLYEKYEHITDLKLKLI